MSELGDVVRDEDWDEMNDAEDRVRTERLLRGDDPWPLQSLPLKRWDGEGVAECGYVNHGFETIVRTETGLVRVRTYADIEQLLDAGWRAD